MNYLMLKMIALLILLPLGLFAQAVLVNNGAYLKITAATDLKIDQGGVLNQANGQIDNEGNLYLDQDWNQFGISTSYAGNGWVWFEGSSNQALTSISALTISKLGVDNGNRLILNNSLVVSSQLDLMNNGRVELNSSNLSLSSAAAIVNYDPNNYIITNSTGYLEQQVASTQVVFPVGNSSYNPAFLTNNGMADNFNVRVENQALESYPSGMIDLSDNVQRAWMIDEQVSGGSDVSMTLQWDAPQEVLDFNRTVSGIAHWDNGSWDFPIFTPALSTGTAWQQSRSGINTFSPFVIKDETDFLPIDLLFFEAERLNASIVRLDWVTTEEIDNRGFEIQRMYDYETSFAVVGWKDAIPESGAYNQYQFDDVNSYKGLSYYRFKQIDHSGGFAYSPVRVVRGLKKNGSIAVYPNPSKANLFVQFSDIPSQTVVLKIYSMEGKLLYNHTISIDKNELVNVEKVQELVPGLYHLQVLFNDSEPAHFEFVKE